MSWSLLDTCFHRKCLAFRVPEAHGKDSIPPRTFTHTCAILPSVPGIDTTADASLPITVSRFLPISAKTPHDVRLRPSLLTFSSMILAAAAADLQLSFFVELLFHLFYPPCCAHLQKTSYVPAYLLMCFFSVLYAEQFSKVNLTIFDSLCVPLLCFLSSGLEIIQFICTEPFSSILLSICIPSIVALGFSHAAITSTRLWSIINKREKIPSSNVPSSFPLSLPACRTSPKDCWTSLPTGCCSTVEPNCSFHLVQSWSWRSEILGGGRSDMYAFHIGLLQFSIWQLFEYNKLEVFLEG